MQQELNSYVKEVLQDAIDDRRGSAHVFKREFEFNCFDVVLDFSRGVAVVQDVLIADESGDQEVSMSEFIEICSLK